MGFAAYCILSAFKSIQEEPNWELVYPELSLGYVHDDEELTNSKDNDTAAK